MLIASNLLRGRNNDLIMWKSFRSLTFFLNVIKYFWNSHQSQTKTPKRSEIVKTKAFRESKRYDFGPFHNVSSPTFGNIFAFFLIFKRGQNEEVQRKNCAEITGRENGKKNSN